MDYKYIEKIQKFMYKRYGPDNLYHFLLKLYICIFIINIILRNTILNIIELLIVIIMFYRFFSKNKYKRSKENKIYLSIKKKVSSPFLKTKKYFIEKYKKIKDPNYIYKKCNKCSTTLRLPIPNKYGIKHVKCPKCKKRIRVLCLKKEKIEVIKKKGRKNS